jgi:hypothetical protein
MFARDHSFCIHLLCRHIINSDLIVIFRENRKLHKSDYDLQYSVGGPAHMQQKGFQRSLATIAVRFVRRDARTLQAATDGSTHHLTAENSREKALLLLKNIANSRGVRMMALRPRRYAHVRFVSRMNGFK